MVSSTGHGRHDLSRLAVAALGNIILDPGHFYRMVNRYPFDGNDFLPLRVSWTDGQ
jgi:hypothetical protein